MMMDKNGREIRTGDVVRITGAYFKTDNGLYFVNNSPGDCSWLGSDYSLHKINRNGTLSKSGRSIGFWPIFVTVSDRFKTAEARAWNKEHAEIEILDTVDRSHIQAHFLSEAADLAARIERELWHFGEDSPVVAKDREIMEHYKTVAASIA